MSNSLPSRPNLEHLKKQAKDLLKAHQSNARDAINRVKVVFPLPAPFGLAQAQLVVAREYGFESWTKLKIDLETSRSTRIEKANSIAGYLVAGRADTAFSLLEEDPTLASETLAAACALGQSQTVQEFLDRDLVKVDNRIAPNGWEPLLYLCYSRALAFDSLRPGLLATAQLLLDRGANPNAFWVTDGFDEACLYGATGVNDCPPLAEMLLVAGADPNDGESLYHAAELIAPDCYELILRYGGRPSKVNNAIGRLLDFEKPDWLRMVLNFEKPEDLPAIIPHAMRRGRSTEVIKLLVDSGMNLNIPDQGGLTPYRAATRLGRKDVCNLLADAGANSDLTKADELIGDIAAGRRINVDEVTSDLIASLSSERSPQIVIWAEQGNLEAVRALISLGANPNACDENGSAPLHQASWHGRTEMVEFLLQHGANPNQRDAVYNGTPANWACVAAENHPTISIDRFVDTVRLLLDAGSEIPSSEQGRAEMMALLRERREMDLKS